MFCHNNPWVIIGETVMGNGERAFELYKKIAPAYLEEISEIHKTEPYVYSQMIAGRDAVRAGEGEEFMAYRHGGVELLYGVTISFGYTS